MIKVLYLYFGFLMCSVTVRLEAFVNTGVWREDTVFPSVLALAVLLLIVLSERRAEDEHSASAKPDAVDR